MWIAIILGIFFCLAIEHARPGWKLPRVPGWFGRVAFLNSLQLAIVLIAGITWDAHFATNAPTTPLTHLPALVSGFIAYFIATFVFYWWHRWRHESDTLWRFFHQIHHSPQRLELITSFYKHPLEMTVNSLIGAALVYPLLGLTVEAAACYTMFTALGEFFYHTNVTTPRWVGFIFQRPEMHRIHHQFGRHKNNYGDFVWWDMLFGTYENPERFEHTCGFESARECALPEMLRFHDVHKTISAPQPNHTGENF